MFSVPPATTISASPALIICAAIDTALNPEPHNIFIVNAGLSTGIPALIETCLATFGRRADCITHPK